MAETTTIIGGKYGENNTNTFSTLQIKIFTTEQTGAPSADYGVISFDHVAERVGINGKWYGTSASDYAALKNIVDKLDGDSTVTGSVAQQIQSAISGLVTDKIGSLTGTSVPNTGATSTVTDYLTEIQSEIDTLNGGTGVNGSVDKKIADAISANNTDNAAAHSAALSAVQGVTVNDVPFTVDPSTHVASGAITSGDIQVGTGTSATGTVKKKLEDLEAAISAGGSAAVLKLFKDQTELTGDNKIVHADNSVYELQQGGDSYDATKVVAKFQIEKDSFVKEGALVYGPATGLNGGTTADTNESANPADASGDLPERKTPYLKLVIKTTDNDVENYIYIKADQLVDTYTGATGPANTGVDISVNNNVIGATLRIANGTTGTAVTGTATSAANVSRTSITQVANTVSVTTTNGTVTDANVGAGVSVDVAGAANAAYNDAKDYVDGLGGSQSGTVTGTATAAQNATRTSIVQVADNATITTSGGQISSVSLGTGVSADAAGAANAAYADSVDYTNQVISWTIVS